VYVFGGPYAVNPYGHAAVSIQGLGTYSLFVGGPAGTSLKEYVDQQKQLRDIRMYVLPTNSDQDMAAYESLLENGFGGQPGDRTRNMVNYPIDTCGTKTFKAYNAAGLNEEAVDPLSGADVFPGTLEDIIKRRIGGGPNKGYKITIPKGGAVHPAIYDLMAPFQIKRSL